MNGNNKSEAITPIMAVMAKLQTATELDDKILRLKRTSLHWYDDWYTASIVDMSARRNNVNIRGSSNP
jgi:hypothetical protein